MNFRSTLGFVTDGVDQTFVGDEFYPTTRNGLTFGYIGAQTEAAFDRDDTIDVRLAGEHTRENEVGPISFRVDLEVPGEYRISLALGSAITDRSSFIEIYDNNTLRLTLGPLDTLAAEFADAEGTVWTAAQWPGSNVAVVCTITSGILKAVLGNVSGTSTSAIAHLAFSLAAPSASVSPSLSPSASASPSARRPGATPTR